MKEVTIVEKFVNHKLFKESFVNPVGNECWIFKAPHCRELSVSVIRGPHTYGGRNGLFELAMIRYGECVYDTPITNDVIGWLSVSKVLEVLLKVEKLKWDLEELEYYID